MRIPYDPIRHSIGGEFAWAQDQYVDAIESQYNAGKPVRIIILKARQLGMSTITEGVLFNWLFLHPGTHALVLAHETATSEELYAKTRNFWDTWPLRPNFHLRYETKQGLHFQETGSQIKIATAGNRVTGRGITSHAVHLSEVAFYPDPKRMLLGLKQSIPDKHGTFIVLESTANGIGNYFYTAWNEAVTGESAYLPLFFPWWKHPEYLLPTRLSIASEITADEKHVRKLMLAEGFTDDRIFQAIEWRRFTLKNKVDSLEEFMQEYPAEPEDAFLSTGTPVFNHRSLRDCYHDNDCPCNGGVRGFIREQNGAMRFVRDASGPVTIFKSPSREDLSRDRYFLGATADESIYGGECCIQVIRRDTNEQVAVYHRATDPRTFGHDIIALGYYYNGAMVCPEAEGSGQETISTILDANYPNVWLHTWADKTPGKKSSSYGWSMNINRRKWAVGRTIWLFDNQRALIHDLSTYNQLRDYSHWGNGADMGCADPDGDESAVLALIIAYRASATETPYTPNRPEDTPPVLDIFAQLDQEGVFRNAYV